MTAHDLSIVTWWAVIDPLQQNHAGIYRLRIQPLYDGGPAFEHGALVDVAFVRDFSRIDRGRLFEQNCASGVG